jgi:hypothetical protein
MPPKTEEQPGVIERLRFVDWIVQELQREMADKGGFTAHLDPKKGNFVDHDLLFKPLPEGIQLVPTSSPARIWRVTPPGAHHAAERTDQHRARIRSEEARPARPRRRRSDQPRR